MIAFCPFYRHVIVLSALFFLFCNSAVAQLPSPKHEVRAVWLTTIGGLDWPHTRATSEASIKLQQRELCDILDKLKSANINTILLQTRIRGTMIYPSIYEPWDGCLSGTPGKSPGYDALQFAIDECHRRGMEIHAWIVTIPVGKWNNTGCQRLRKRYPKMIRKIGDEGYMDPEYGETADYLGRICREIADSYDVDGIHLDYIRYPETWKMRVSQQVGRQHITRIVRHIHQAVKSIKPWIKISCAPIGKYDDLPRYSSHGWNARTRVCQDAQAWLRDGLMDVLFPMTYFRGDQFYPFVLDWQENSCGRLIAAGLGIYQLSPEEKDWAPDIIQRQMSVLRRHSIGHAYFRSRFFTDNVKGIYDFALHDIDSHPALVPPMTWQCDRQPSPPSRLTVRRTTDGDYLEWGDAEDNSGGPYLLYNVYASTTWPVDTADACNLIAIRCQRQPLLVARHVGSPTLHYAVTATDRYGNESQPALSPEPQPQTDKHYITLLDNNGLQLPLPPKGHALDAPYLTIETLQGTIVATKPYRDTYADISDLPEGIYVLKSLGRKAVTHRIGLFTIKRK